MKMIIKKRQYKVLAALLTIIILFTSVNLEVFAKADIPADWNVVTLDSGKYDVEFSDVKFHQSDARASFDSLNAWRINSDNWWYRDQNNNIVPYDNIGSLKYDYQLESYAMLRAKELLVSYSHSRPNDLPGLDFGEPFQYGGAGENIDILNTTNGYTSNITTMWNGFIEEDDIYISQGHRRNMLNPEWKSVGIAVIECGSCAFYVVEYSSVDREDYGYSNAATSSCDSVIDYSTNVDLDWGHISIITLIASMDTIFTGDELSFSKSTFLHQNTQRMTNGIQTTLDIPITSHDYTGETSDSSVIEATDNSFKAVGVGTATITLKDLTYGTSETKEITVVKKDDIVDKSTDVADATVTLYSDYGIYSDATPFTYTGEAIIPRMNVSIDGVSLAENQDYTIEVTDNINIGTATLTISGIGKYHGTKTVTFQISEEQYDYFLITYRNLDGAENNPLNPSKYRSIDTVELKEPTKAGYRFVGWYSDSRLTTPITTVKGQSVFVYAKWEPITYKVHYDGNGSTSGSMRDSTFTANSSSVYLSTNTFAKTDFVFDCWAYDPEGLEKVSYNTIPKEKLTQDITVYAIWKKFEVPVTYVLNGGTFENGTDGYIDGSYYVFPIPVKEGYTFKGWFKDKTFTSAVSAKVLKTSAKGTLYAKWSANKYTISFDKGIYDGSVTGTMGAVKYSYGKTYALPTLAYKKKGYQFVGWTDENGVYYQNGESIKNLSSENGKQITFTANWVIKDYDIIFNVNKGGFADLPKTTYTYEDETYTLPIPERTGYDFSGWFGDSAFKTKAVTEIKHGSTGKKTFYAKWTAHKYRVTFDTGVEDNSVTGYMPTVKYTYGKKYELPANAYKKKGYQFIGWVDAEENVYSNSQKVSNLSAVDKAIVNLKGTWQVKVYPITYNLNKGYFDEFGMVLNNYTVNTEDYTLPIPTRVGYDFGGWYTDSSFKTKAVTGIKHGSTGKKTFYAKWIAHKYQVVFDKGVDDGSVSGSMPTVKYTYGKKYELPANAYKKKGYYFTGWIDENGYNYSNRQFVSNLEVENGAVKTLYAQWQIKPYPITYNLNKGRFDESDEVLESYTVENDEYVLPIPTRTGYEFKGWYTSSTFSKDSRIEKISAHSTGKLTLYAKWK